jgi:hypothetical protein
MPRWELYSITCSSRLSYKLVEKASAEGVFAAQPAHRSAPGTPHVSRLREP